MTRSRIIISLFAGLMSVSLAGAPAAFAQTATKDNMGKTRLHEQRHHVQGHHVEGFDEEGHNVEGHHVQGLDEERRRHVQGQYEKVSSGHGRTRRVGAWLTASELMSAPNAKVDIGWPHAAVMGDTTIVYTCDVACPLDG